jgi:hypothetical protein
MKQLVCTLFVFIIPVALSVGIDSVCYLGGTTGPTQTSVGTYEKRYMEPLDLVSMKSGKINHIFACNNQVFKIITITNVRM